MLQYRHALRERFGYIKFIGLPAQGAPDDVPLERLFVEPVLSVSANADPDDPSIQIGRCADVIARNPRVVVLGDPGTGKSTLCSWILESLTGHSDSELKKKIGPVVPIPIIVRDIPSTEMGSWDRLIHWFASSAIGGWLGGVDRIRELLRTGQAMLIIDGLDEAADPQERDHLISVLHSAVVRYPRTRWLVTSRIVGYDMAAFDVAAEIIRDELSKDDTMDFSTLPYRARVSFGKFKKTFFEWTLAQRLYISGFDWKRIGLFVSNWHYQSESDPGIRSTRSAELLAAIRQSADIAALARTPNLLTLICLVFRVYSRLPDGRALLYDRIVQAYLETIDTSRRLPTAGYTLEEMKRWLGFVAYSMLLLRSAPGSQGDGVLISKADLLRAILQAMGERPTADQQHLEAAADGFVDWVARRAGILVPRSPELFAFAHLSFQEYFAAYFIAEHLTGPRWILSPKDSRGTPRGIAVDALQRAASGVIWHETFVLLFEILASRGEWSEAIFGILFDDLDGPSGKRGLDRKLGDAYARVTRMSLLVELARDSHTGLHESTRRKVFTAAWKLWLQLSANSVVEDSTLGPLSDQLCRPLVRGPSPALEVLHADLIRNQACHLLLTEGARDFFRRLQQIPVDQGWIQSVTFDSLLTADDAVQALFAAESHVGELTGISVAYTEVSDASMAIIAKSSAATSIRAIRASGTSVSDDGFAALFGTSSRLVELLHLELAETAIGLKLDLDHLNFELLQSLVHLDMSFTSVSGAAVAKFVRQAGRSQALHALEVLGLAFAPVDDEFVLAACDQQGLMGRLRELDVRGSKITDRCVRLLASASNPFPYLQRLNISKTMITAPALEQLLEGRRWLSHLSSFKCDWKGIEEQELKARFRAEWRDLEL